MHSLLETEGKMRLPRIQEETGLQAEECQGAGGASGCVESPAILQSLHTKHHLTDALPAQVEVLLHDAVGKTERTAPESKRQRPSQDHDGTAARGREQGDSGPDIRPGIPTFSNGAGESFNWAFGADGTGATSGGRSPPAPPGPSFELPDMNLPPRAANAGPTGYELLGLGLFEALPPAELIEEL